MTASDRDRGGRRRRYRAVECRCWSRADRPARRADAGSPARPPSAAPPRYATCLQQVVDEFRRKAADAAKIAAPLGDPVPPNT